MLEPIKAFVASHLTFIVITWISTLIVGAATKLIARITGSPKWVEWERVHPLLGVVAHLVFGFLGDGQRVAAAIVALYSLAFGKKPDGTPGSQPKPPAVIITTLGVMLLAISQIGCRPALTPESAGAGVLSLAEANRIVAEACGEAAVDVGVQRGKAAGQKVLDQCKANHDRVHGQLLAFADGVDAWRAGRAGAPSCAALDLRQAALDEISFARSIGASISTRVDDAVGFLGFVVSSLLGKCEVPNG